MKLYFLILLSAISVASCAQNAKNWSDDQLMKPAELVRLMEQKIPPFTLISVGPSGLIPNSINIGPVNDSANLQTLRVKLSLLPKEEEIVVYCGCCPYEHCPNIRPALAALKELHFTNYHLLDLPKNIKTDWIDKGYPTIKRQ